MFSKKQFAVVSNLSFFMRTNFMLSWVEHEKSFITLGPELQIRCLFWIKDIIMSCSLRKSTFSHVCPMETDQPGHLGSLICVVIVDMKKLCILGCPKCAKWRFWSGCTNGQVDLNLPWVNMSDGTFSDVVAHIWCTVEEKGYGTSILSKHSLPDVNNKDSLIWAFSVYWCILKYLRRQQRPRSDCLTAHAGLSCCQFMA